MSIPKFDIRNVFTDRPDVPHLSEYFGVWAMHEPLFREMAQRFNGLDLNAHIAMTIASHAKNPESRSSLRRDYANSGGVAVIDVAGPLMKVKSSLEPGSSTVAIRRQIRVASQDPDVTAILLRIDSPGGTVSGTFDLVADIAKYGQRKPIDSYIEDLGASAAYAIGCPCRKIYTNPTGLVGSIGTYMTVQDLSGYAEKMGIKVHVIRPDDGTSDHKGDGVGGTEITDEMIAEWQKIVTQLNAHFLKTVSEGRSLSMKRTKELATGNVWIAAEALENKLVDGVQSFDETLANLSRKGQARRQKMSHDISAFEEACPGADAGFILAQMKKTDATPESAGKAWAQEMALQLAAKNEESDKQLAEERAKREQAEKEAADARAEAAKEKAEREQAAADKPRGVQGTNAGVSADVGATADGSAKERFDDLVAAEVAKGRTQMKAVSVVTAKHPQLHQQMVLEANQGCGRTRAANAWQEDRMTA